jgi:predicted phosphodiesterase
MVKRLGVLGDVHAEDETLLAALEFFETIGVDRVVCVGDVLDGAGDAERCIATLRSQEITTVRGNHERWFIEAKAPGLVDATTEALLSDASLAWLRSLPVLRTIPTVAGPALLYHSLGRDDFSCLFRDETIDLGRPSPAIHKLLEAAAGCRFVINGHTHVPIVRAVGPVLVFDAGTLWRSNESVVSRPARPPRTRSRSTRRPPSSARSMPSPTPTPAGTTTTTANCSPRRSSTRRSRRPWVRPRCRRSRGSGWSARGPTAGRASRSRRRCASRWPGAGRVAHGEAHDRAGAVGHQGRRRDGADPVGRPVARRPRRTWPLTVRGVDVAPGVTSGRGGGIPALARGV